MKNFPPDQSVINDVLECYLRTGNRVHFYFPNINGDLFTCPNDHVMSGGIPHTLHADARAKILYAFYNSEDVIIVCFMKTQIGNAVGICMEPAPSAGRGFA